MHRLFRVSHRATYCIGLSSHSNRLQGLMRGEETVSHKEGPWPEDSMFPDPPYRNISVNKTQDEENLWLIDRPPASHSQTITSSPSFTWICIHCYTSMTRELNIHFPLINSQFIPLPLPISLPFIMHYSPFLNDFLLTVSSNLVFGYGYCC